MPPKLPQNLPDQAAAIKKQSQFKQTAKELADLNQFVTQKTEDAVKEYFRLKPDLKKKLGCNIQPRAYVKIAGSHVVVPAIVEHLLYKDALSKTKKAILEEVKKRFPNQADHIHDNVWYRDLKPALWSRLQTRINGSSKHPISIKGCKTLDDIRDRLIAASVTETADFSAKLSIAVDDKKVIIGKEVYHIVTNTSKGRPYPLIRTSKSGRQQSLNVEVLKIFLRQK